MKLHFISLTKKQLDAIPEAERTLLILCAHAANELNILIKLFRFSSEHPASTDAEERARNAQAMTMGRLLTGKLYECWKLMKSSFFDADLESLGSKEIDVAGAQDWKSITVPYFVEIAESEVT